MRKVLTFALLNLVLLGSLTAPVVTGLPIVIARLVPSEDRTAMLAFVVICGAVTAVVSNPLFGFASDKTRGRFGRRRPWLLGGVVLGLGATIMIVTADSVAVLTFGWVLAQAGYNASLAAAAALIGDQVRERQRASAAGIFSAAAFVGTIPPLALAIVIPARLDLVLLAMPVIAVVVVAGCCSVISDRPLQRVTKPLPRTRSLRNLADVSKNSLFVWIWVQRFAMQMAASLLTVFTLYFVVARMMVSHEMASPIVATTTIAGGVGIVVAALGAGYVAARSGNYGPFIVSAALGLAIAGVLRATALTEIQLWVSAALGGLALGVFYTVDLALALRSIRDGKAGTFLGILNIAETIPQTIAPAIALVLLSVSGPDSLSATGENYTVLYLAGAVLALLALVPLPFLREVLKRKDPEAIDRGQRAGDAKIPVS